MARNVGPCQLSPFVVSVDLTHATLRPGNLCNRRICLKKLKNIGGGDDGDESGGKAAAVEETGSAALVEMLNEISVLS